jgi:hypothetical protein
LAALAGLLAVGTARAEIKGSGSAGVDVVSAYIFRGATVNDNVNVQPHLEGSAYGLTAGSWVNFNTDSSDVDEVDLYGSYALPLGDKSPIGVSLGYTEYTYPNSTTESTAADGTTTVSALPSDREVNVAFSADTLLSPSLTVYRGVGGSLNNSWYVEGSLSHEVALNDDVSVNAGATVGYLDPDQGNSGFSHVQLTLGTSLLKYFSASINYVIQTDKSVLEVNKDVWGSISASVDF